MALPVMENIETQQGAASTQTAEEANYLALRIHAMLEQMREGSPNGPTNQPDVEGTSEVLLNQANYYIRETDKLLEKIAADQQQVDKDAAETRAILQRSDQIMADWLSK